MGAKSTGAMIMTSMTAGYLMKMKLDGMQKHVDRYFKNVRNI